LSSQIISYVYDRTRRHRTSFLPSAVANAADVAASSLNAAALVPYTLSTDISPTATSQEIIARAASTFLEHQSDDISSALLYIYLAHVALLDSIALETRAQHIPTASKELQAYLESTFLPTLYQSLDATVTSIPIDGSFPSFDLDGRLFFLLLMDVLAGSSGPVEDILGAETVAAVDAQWALLGVVSPHPITPRHLILTPPYTVQTGRLIPQRTIPFRIHRSFVHLRLEGAHHTSTLLQPRLR
jgi:hypothetical protein